MPLRAFFDSDEPMQTIMPGIQRVLMPLRAFFDSDTNALQMCSREGGKNVLMPLRAFFDSDGNPCKRCFERWICLNALTGIF